MTAMPDAQEIAAIADTLADDGIVISDRIVGQVLQARTRLDEAAALTAIRKELRDWEQSGYTDSTGVLERIGGLTGHAWGG